jgi:pimeloyl-ACP methyl ester carboxylesterase
MRIDPRLAVACTLFLMNAATAAVHADDALSLAAEVRIAVEDCQPDVEEGDRAARDFFFDSNDVKIHYTDEGKGEPVLLIHGFTADIVTNWRIPGISKALAQDYRVIAIDNRGHGKSDKPRDASKYGMEMVEDAIRLLDHLKIEKSHIAGYSMGGIITLKLVVTHPERVTTATLGGAGWMDEKDLSPDKLADALETTGDISEFINDMTPPGSPKMPEPQIKLIAALIAARNDMKALAAVVRGWHKLIVTEEELQGIRVPTLAIVGANDFVKPKVERLSGRVPGIKIVEIEKADHLAAFFSPQFAKELKAFLNQHAPADK